MYSGEDLYGRSVGERARSHYQIGSEGVEVSQPLSSQSSALNEPSLRTFLWDVCLLPHLKDTL